MGKQKSFLSIAQPVLAMVLLLPWLLGASGCPNLLANTADKTTDAAVFYDAQISIDAGDYSGALAKLAAGSSSAQTSHQGRIMMATAYAGRCGLDVVDLAQKFSVMGSSTLFNTFLGAYHTVTASSTAPADCYSAEQQVLAVNSNEMTKDDWVFLAFVEFAKVGTTLAKIADTDDDGVVDPSFVSCSMADADAGQVGTGLTIALNAINNSGVALLSAVTTSLTSLCTTAASTSGDAQICAHTDASSFTANDLKVFKSMIEASEIGFNTCGGTTGSAGCICP